MRADQDRLAEELNGGAEEGEEYEEMGDMDDMDDVMWFFTQF